jgi:hypothetical protein
MTVLVAGSRGDALRLQVGASNVQHLALIGTIRGVTPLAVAGRCGEGTGSIRSFGSPPRRFAFRAPGSSTWGEEVTVGSTGDYLLEDGDDTNKWLRVRIDLAWLADVPAEARVFLRDRYNELGPDDVTSSEASAGSVETLTVTCANVGSHRLASLKAWLEVGVSGIELSPDNVAWSAPTSEGAGVALGNVEAGLTVPLYLRRTITAGAASAAKVLNQINFSWEGA